MHAYRVRTAGRIKLKADMGLDDQLKVMIAIEGSRAGKRSYIYIFIYMQIIDVRGGRLDLRMIAVHGSIEGREQTKNCLRLA